MIPLLIAVDTRLNPYETGPQWSATVLLKDRAFTAFGWTEKHAKESVTESVREAILCGQITPPELWNTQIILYDRAQAFLAAVVVAMVFAVGIIFYAAIHNA